MTGKLPEQTALQTVNDELPRINGLNSMDYRILYTFRRCPYAIRARMALAYSKIDVHQHEVDLKNKPPELLKASAKGTVPVLLLEDGRVLEQSMDIIIWALTQSDPDGWLSTELKEQGDDLIYYNDIKFKPLLDNYKYPKNSEKNDPAYYRDKARIYLNQLNSLLKSNRYLLTDHISFADVAIFPFIRQFYMVDTQWFEQSEYKYLQTWLSSFLNSELFIKVMKKIP
ncbi:glutathione S-transferase [Legionella maioricensis]|uniref:Glutathione S-transferase n=1 Tax=Legionella maioricensis TaxID=2896528 RepID=A0A9X2IDJ6_9GAMM|nr:glutathione S-transferase [Legionella maioricensis]MCL9684848.1 glutathione S-transferase [Legionella maioricensis]MCL9688528.1 glutathione S-transferase [Legionella maioricensis]